jgi:hypothetical protein
VEETATRANPVPQRFESSPPAGDGSAGWASFGRPYLPAWEEVHRLREDVPFLVFWDSVAPTWVTRWQRNGTYWVTYHDPGAPGVVHLEMQVEPTLQLCYGEDRLTYLHNHYAYLSTENDPPPSSATAEIVEFEPPADLAALYNYRYGDPRVRRVLATLSSTDPAPVRIDLEGPRLIGIRLTTLPTDPGPLAPPPYPEGHPFHRIHLVCQAFVWLNFLSE